MNARQPSKQLISIFKLELADKYPQYLSYLQGPVRVVRAKKTYHGKYSNSLWFNKGDLLLAFKLPENRDIWNPKTKKFDKKCTYITIYSPHCKSMCLTPINKLEVVEIVQ